MQDEQNPQMGGQPSVTPTPTPNQADQEWSDLQRDLDILGRQLSELSLHSAALGDHFLTSLKQRFDEVQQHASAYRQASLRQAEAAHQAAWSQAQTALGDAKARSTEAARQVWERSEPLRQGARDVGEGLSRAWTELRASFGKAAGRLQIDTPPNTANGPVPAPTNDDRRETT